jgi:hypothetical protein
LTSQQHSTVPINDLSTPLSIDTPIFSGTALLCLRHMPSTPKGVFEGKRRQMVLTVQVRVQGTCKHAELLCISVLFCLTARASFLSSHQHPTKHQHGGRSHCSG